MNGTNPSFNENELRLLRCCTRSSMRPVFLFVDLLEDFFIQPPLATQRPALVQAVNELAHFARANAYPVVWVRQEFEPDLSDAFLRMRETGRRVTIKGTKGCELLSDLHQQPSDHMIVKKRYSAFFNTNLAELLHTLTCTHLVIAGVNTQACIRATAIDAYQMDYRIFFATEGISSYDAEFHRESMRYLQQSIGDALTNHELKERLTIAAATS